MGYFILSITAKEILFPVALLVGLAVIFAVAIAFFSKKFVVHEDEKVEKITELLAGANCGGCGYGGCADFAKAVVEGKVNVSACGVTSKHNRDLIAEILGGDAAELTTVVCLCCGGDACIDKYDYQGYGDCANAEILAGGRKACPNGCIGMGKCLAVCPEGAIKITKGVAFVDQKLCVNCGRCIFHCPKNIMRRIPAKAVYYVACANRAKGNDVRKVCYNGCISCGLCVRVCPEGALTMVDNLPVFDYGKCTACGLCFQKCPAKCIRKIDRE